MYVDKTCEDTLCGEYNAHGNLVRAGRFQVPLPFLLQQAAWLYERQLSQVRAQMRKVGKSGTSNTGAPTSGSASGTGTPGGQQMKRGGSTGMGMSAESPSVRSCRVFMQLGPRVPSSMSIRSKDSPMNKGDSSRPSTPTKFTG